MRLIPVNLSVSNRTILEANSCEALQLSPVSGAKALLKERKVTDAATTCDRFDAADFPDDLERFEGHSERVARRSPVKRKLLRTDTYKVTTTALSPWIQRCEVHFLSVEISKLRLSRRPHSAMLKIERDRDNYSLKPVRLRNARDVAGVSHSHPGESGRASDREEQRRRRGSA